APCCASRTWSRRSATTTTGPRCAPTATGACTRSTGAPTASWTRPRHSVRWSPAPPRRCRCSPCRRRRGPEGPREKVQSMTGQNLSGRTALRTWAGQCVGHGIAHALAARGAAVALAGRSLEKVEKTAAQVRERGGTAEAFACDVTDPDRLTGMVDEVVERFGGLSILVNNAHTVFNGPLLGVGEDEYSAVMESGPRATWRLMRACHPHLTGGGVIVNLGSAAGVRWDPSGYGVYGAAKEAIRVLTRTAACEWADDGIRVNAVLP